MNTGLPKNDQALKLQLYPNPADHLLTLDFELSQSTLVKVSVYNIIGQPLLNVDWNLPLGTNQKQLDISKLPDGIYILKMSTGDRIISRNFVKN